MEEKVKLINHASLYMKFNNKMQVLTDPWYNGFAFDGGWSLLYENEDEYILNLLNQVNYIYITHEHPDHFSISFFKKFSQILKEKNIKIIFQKTLDKRVQEFLNKKFNLEILILENYKTVKINDEKITLITCGAIDSSLIIETKDCYHINLNDCDFVHAELIRIKKFLKNRKKIIIYLQFSYAAFRSDNDWMKKAADFKLVNLLNVYNFFNADLIIPFASFVYFSSSENFHLNKYMNNVEITSNFLRKHNVNHCFLNPDLEEIKIETLLIDKSVRSEVTKKSVNFWDSKFKNIKIKDEINQTCEISEESKKKFLLRIKKSNSFFLLFLIRILSFKYFFGDVCIYLKDTKETYVINFFKIIKKINIPKEQIDIQMLSRRFDFLIKNPFGIDTISSNGCFFENKKNSFEKMIRAIGFVTLNQTNNGITVKSIFRRNILNKILSIFIRLKLKNS